ncbi:transposase [Streptomyces sviceus]
MREVVNTLLHQGRAGCQRDLLPHDFPPAVAVKHYFRTWRDDGTEQRPFTTCCAGAVIRAGAG